MTFRYTPLVSFSESLRNFEKAEIATSASIELLFFVAGVEDPNFYIIAGVFAGIGTTVFLLEQAARGIKRLYLALRAKVGSAAAEEILLDHPSAPLTNISGSAVD